MNASKQTASIFVVVFSFYALVHNSGIYDRWRVAGVHIGEGGQEHGSAESIPRPPHLRPALQQPSMRRRERCSLYVRLLLLLVLCFY